MGKRHYMRGRRAPDHRVTLSPGLASRVPRRPGGSAGWSRRFIDRRSRGLLGRAAPTGAGYEKRRPMAGAVAPTGAALLSRRRIPLARRGLQWDRALQRTGSLGRSRSSDRAALSYPPANRRPSRPDGAAPRALRPDRPVLSLAAPNGRAQAERASPGPDRRPRLQFFAKRVLNQVTGHDPDMELSDENRTSDRRSRGRGETRSRSDPRDPAPRLAPRAEGKASAFPSLPTAIRTGALARHLAAAIAFRQARSRFCRLHAAFVD